MQAQKLKTFKSPGMIIAKFQDIVEHMESQKKKQQSEALRFGISFL